LNDLCTSNYFSERLPIHENYSVIDKNIQNINIKKYSHRESPKKSLDKKTKKRNLFRDRSVSNIRKLKNDDI
jgi:hypothetical protein